jgi:Zn-dependent peptidase ImmA (M78 family)/DNA-binding XRE family transcriptional regulator
MNGEIQINPELLKWAREECGYSKGEIANKIHVEQEQYSVWEDTGTGLSLSNLIALSKVCKRQIAFFFLPSVPPKTKKPTDFRNLEPKRARLTEKTLLAIRRAVRYQEFLLQLHGNEYYKEKYKWISEYKDSLKELPKNINDITDWVRGLLNYPINEQLADGISPEDSYKRWRDSVEQHLGIHVFQFTMVGSEVQGFSYADSPPYCIVINNTYPATSRSFTLFHELSHVMKNQSGLCKPHDTFFEREDSVEYDCNSFAGCLLVPAKELIPAHDKNKIFEYATRFKISSEVYLRRLFTLGYVSEAEFFVLLKQIRESVLPPKLHYSRSPISRSINSRGNALFNSTVYAIKQGQISYSLASDILGLKINYLFSL